MRVVMIVDEELYDSTDPEFSRRQPEKHFETEFHVSAALRELNAKVTSVPATQKLGDLLKAIKRAGPDVVFNLVEHIGGRRTADSTIASILEVEGLPYTGASARTLLLARDKFLSKVVVSHAGVLVPDSFVVKPDVRIRTVPLKFPAIVKPLYQDASEGISAKSYATNWKQLRTQVERVVEEFQQPAMCEEFVEGREIYVTLSGISRVTIDSICELVFPSDGRVKFATQKVKFDEQYRRRSKVFYTRSTQFTAELKRNILRSARLAYQALDIASYAKLEFRIRGDNVFFLEANPNAHLSRFSSSTDFAKINFTSYIRKILRMAIAQHDRRRNSGSFG